MCTRRKIYHKMSTHHTSLWIIYSATSITPPPPPLLSTPSFTEISTEISHGSINDQTNIYIYMKTLARHTNLHTKLQSRRLAWCLFRGFPALWVKWAALYRQSVTCQICVCIYSLCAIWKVIHIHTNAPNIMQKRLCARDTKEVEGRRRRSKSTTKSKSSNNTPLMCVIVSVFRVKMCAE